MARHPKWLQSVEPRAGQEILVQVPHYWARGKTLDEALKNLRRITSTRRPMAVHSVPPGAQVDAMGWSIEWALEDDPEGLRTTLLATSPGMKSC